MNTAVRKGSAAFLGTVRALGGLGEVSRGTLGVVLHAFGPLLRTVGTKAGKDIAILELACEAALIHGSKSAHGAAFKAARRLLKQAARLPADEGLSVTIQLERRIQTLMFHDGDFGATLAKAAESERNAAVLLRGTRRASGKAGGEAAAEELSRLAEQVHARFHKRMRGARKANPALYASFRRLRKAVPAMTAGMLDASRKAAQQGARFRELLEQYGKTRSTAVLSELWGIVSGVRGSLGEAYALASPIWRNEADLLLADAMNDAFRLTEAAAARSRSAQGAAESAYEAVELLQAEHRLFVNGREGPDAMIAIINPAQRRMIVRARAQVKTAKVSEAVKQTLSDDLRLAGVETGKAPELPLVAFTRNGKEEVYVLEVLPSVREDLYVLDFGGSRTAAKDLDALAVAGRRAESLIMDMTVDDFTALAMEMLEAAVASAP